MKNEFKVSGGKVLGMPYVDIEAPGILIQPNIPDATALAEVLLSEGLSLTAIGWKRQFEYDNHVYSANLSGGRVSLPVGDGVYMLIPISEAPKVGKKIKAEITKLLDEVG